MTYDMFNLQWVYQDVTPLEIEEHLYRKRTLLDTSQKSTNDQKPYKKMFSFISNQRGIK